MAKQNDGAPGVDGVTFEAIEAQGAEALLEQLRDELTARIYKPLPARRDDKGVHWFAGPPQKPRRSRANLLSPSRSASAIDRLLKNQNPIGKS